MDWNPRYLYNEIFQEETEMEYFLSEICSPSWNAKMDANRSFEEGISELLPVFPEFAEQIRLYHTRCSEESSPIVLTSCGSLRKLDSSWRV